MTNLETNFREVLTREAVRFCSRAVRLFSGPARANAYGPHTGLSSMVLQRKRSQGRTGHIITLLMSLLYHLKQMLHFHFSLFLIFFVVVVVVTFSCFYRFLRSNAIKMLPRKLFANLTNLNDL